MYEERICLIIFLLSCKILFVLSYIFISGIVISKVKLAERYSMERNDEDDKNDTEFKSLVVNIGIANPISRKGAGRLYHRYFFTKNVE